MGKRVQAERTRSAPKKTKTPQAKATKKKSKFDSLMFLTKSQEEINEVLEDSDNDFV